MNAKNRRNRKASRKPPEFEVSSKARCITVEVDDPYFNAAHAEGAGGNRKKIHAAYNMMESPIAYMIAKGQVNQGQGEAGLHFRRIFEAAGGAGAQAMDYTKEPVDGGMIADPITERQWQAGQELREAHAMLGQLGYDLVRDVCGRGCFIKDLYPTKWQQTKAGKNLQNCLTTLSHHWGYETRQIRKWKSRVDMVKAV